MGKLTENLDQFYTETSQRHYNLLFSTYKRRLDKASDKAYTHSEFQTYAKAMLIFRFEESYRAPALEHFMHDLKVGKELSLSIKKLRKNFKPKYDTISYDFEEIIEPFEIDGKSEDNKREQVKPEKPIFDLNEYSDKDLVRIFAEYMAYRRFFEFLESEDLKYSLVEKKSETTPSLMTASEGAIKDSTTARQVLAVHYLLKYANVKNIDKTEIARFIQFLTGKNFDNIYKRLQNPFKINEKALNEDLRFVRNYFERLEMSEVVKMINNELG
ncbi:MAG: hypothetical protein WCM76_16140 [Bacteroidota bacterium]